jgi:hypothetical protein
MALILQIVAAVLTVLGAGTLYWGTTPSLLSLGNFVMVVGAIIAAAGIVLFGLAAVLGQLGVLAAKLDDLRWALGNPAGAGPVAVAPPADAPAPLGAAATTAVPAEPVPEPSPFWREGLPEQPVVPPAGAAASRAAAVTTPSPGGITPPSRESFGLPPLAAGAALGAAAGVAAGLASAAPASPAPPEAAAERQPAFPPLPPLEEPAHPDVPELPVIEPARIEPVLVEPVLSDDSDLNRPADKHEQKDDAGAAANLAQPADELEQHLALAVEELKEEVKAAEADIAAPEAGTTADGGSPDDPMASLEKLLLGDQPQGRAPADERQPDGFMARLRDTFSRAPASPPEPEPEPATTVNPQEAEPLAASEDVASGDLKEPVAPEPAALAPEPVEEPRFSIEDELEKALKASLEEKPIGSPDLGSIRPAPPVYASPGPSLAPEPRISPEPDPRAAPEVTIERTGGSGGREDAMAALVRDFPELNDLLAPKKAAPSPADSLIEDLKDIFEPPAGAAPARQEPALAPSLPPPPAAAAVPLLREGVIANIPFRLYGDGTIEADLEAGTTRFASLKDFRAHVGG